MMELLWIPIKAKFYLFISTSSSYFQYQSVLEIWMQIHIILVFSYFLMIPLLISIKVIIFMTIYQPAHRRLNPTRMVSKKELWLLIMFKIV